MKDCRAVAFFGRTASCARKPRSLGEGGGEKTHRTAIAPAGQRSGLAKRRQEEFVLCNSSGKEAIMAANECVAFEHRQLLTSLPRSIPRDMQPPTNCGVDPRQTMLVIARHRNRQLTVRQVICSGLGGCYQLKAPLRSGNGAILSKMYRQIVTMPCPPAVQTRSPRAAIACRCWWFRLGFRYVP